MARRVGVESAGKRGPGRDGDLAEAFVGLSLRLTQLPPTPPHLPQTGLVGGVVGVDLRLLRLSLGDLTGPLLLDHGRDRPVVELRSLASLPLHTLAGRLKVEPVVLALVGKVEVGLDLELHHHSLLHPRDLLIDRQRLGSLLPVISQALHSKFLCKSQILKSV